MTGGRKVHEDGATSNTITGGIFFHAVIQGRDITVQLPPAITPALSGLPAPASAFTGRDQHVKQLLADLAPAEGVGGHRTVLVSAVSGLAGIGKTELAVQTAAQALKQPGWFPGGVLFTDLAGYDPQRRLSPERALEGLLRALAIPGEHIPNGLADRQRLYRSVLATYAREGRRVLVVVDNASTTAQARPLLPTDGTTTALVTSRHTLDGLDARLHDLGVLDTQSSLALLDAALRAARGDADTRFTDAPEATETVATLCAGLPLALRIAAAVLAAAPTRPAASLAEALRDEHNRLDELERPDGADLKPPERAVRASFNLSYTLLDNEHAQLFRLLPLNPGPDLSTEAASCLADTTKKSTARLLQHLADAHLIEHGQAWGRWRIHDLVRLYADEHGRTHANSDQRDTARLRLFTHYQDATQAANTHLDTHSDPRAIRFRDRDHALEWLDAEHPNLTATATAAPALGHPAITTSLAFSLAQYLKFRRYFDDWITLSTTALPLIRESGDRHGEIQVLNNLGLALQEVRRFEEAIDAHAQGATLLRQLGARRGESQALNNLGLALREARRFEEAFDTHIQGLIICRMLGDRYGEGMALTHLGLTLHEMRRFEEAITAHAHAATLFRQFGDRHGEGGALTSLGIALQAVRRFEEAIDAHTQGATIFRQLGDRHGESQALNNLGGALHEVRRFEEAIDAHTLAANIHRELGDRHGESQALNNLGLALQAVRRFEEAIDAQTQGLAICRELGDRHGESQALNNLGLTLRKERRFEEAIDAHTLAANIHRELGDRHGESQALNSLGNAMREVRRFEEAIDAHTQGATIFRQLGDLHGEGGALNSLGLTLREVRRFEEAIDAHAQAAIVYRQLGDRHNEGRALNNLGIALQEVRRFEEGIDAHAQDLAICRELGDRHGEGGALNNLGAALLKLGRFEEAMNAYAQAAAIFRQLGDRHNESGALNNLRLALREVHPIEETIDLQTEDLSTYQGLGDDDSASELLTAIAHNERWLRRS
ncbi:tetratricopeptide repeat protein [Streptomyces griseorubiginosus]|uniref:tetratricopeptide repeat protein n=1 Tax=Streptomyces griseorubiginosus TaxID=67304 RepID=UPI00368F9085